MIPAGPPPLHGARLVSDDGLVRCFEGYDPAGAATTVLVLTPAAAVDPRIRDQFVRCVQAAQSPSRPVVLGAQAREPWAAALRPAAGIPGLETLIPQLQQAVRTGVVPRRRRVVPKLALALGAVVVLAVGGIAAITATVGTDPDRARVLPAGLADDFPTLVGPEPVFDPAADPVTVVGPAFAPNEEHTRTFAFDGFPFAFRGTDVWICDTGISTIPGSYGLICADEEWEENQIAEIMVRKCPGGCPAERREEWNAEWFGDLDDVERSDDTTWYREGSRGGLETAAMSHYFVRDGITWHVGVHVESPSEELDEVLVLLNDIRSQTP